MDDASVRFETTFSPDDEVVPGVKFGRPEWVPSPAFWQKLAEMEGDTADAYISPSGTPLVEDVAFCLLGGYGIKMEINRAAWEHLKAAGIFDGADGRAEIIEELLRQPLYVEGRKVHYRFPRQRAERLAIAIDAVSKNNFERYAPLQLRDRLMLLSGIGPKTASWIVRNWAGSNDVAILDVHVLRAGALIGLFPQHVSLPKDYSALEQKFLKFAQCLRVPASLLDAIMWREMRILTR